MIYIKFSNTNRLGKNKRKYCLIVNNAIVHKSHVITHPYVYENKNHEKNYWLECMTETNIIMWKADIVIIYNVYAVFLADRYETNSVLNNSKTN